MEVPPITASAPAPRGASLETYFSIDVETDGPIPGEFSLLSVGAAVAGTYDGTNFHPTNPRVETFYAELVPTGRCASQREALEVNGLDLRQLRETGEDPSDAMRRLSDWVSLVSGDTLPVAVSHPASFDWMWLHWYFVKYIGVSPFGFAGSFDLKTLWSTVSGLGLRLSSLDSYPPVFRSSAAAHTHHALEDAVEQAEIFQNLYSRVRAPRWEGRIWSPREQPATISGTDGAMDDVFERRSRHSTERLAQVVQRTSDLGAALAEDGACVYATGSLGRLEANEHSDLDLFILDGLNDLPRLGRIKTARLVTDLEQVSRELNFPPFTDDGVYLDVHHLPEILAHMGDREDDARNYFTARLLLLLEGRAVCNQAGFEVARTKFVESYFRDYLRHRVDFRPMFLLNDISRFWKTLALNYESRRNASVAELGATDPANERPKEWAKLSSKNLKLKFSRLLTCYSAIIAILAEYAQAALSPETAIEIFTASPVGRLERAAASDGKAAPSIMAALEEYRWFLEWTEKAPADQLSLMEDVDFRTEAFNIHAAKFGEYIYEAVLAAGSPTGLTRFLVV